jgi:hypothetical protein
MKNDARMILVLLLMSFLSVAAHAADPSYRESELIPFVSDGCTNSPDGDFGDSIRWLGCCYVHDQRYYAGGTENDRLDADIELGHCIQRLSGSESLASIYFTAVRLAGGPERDTDYRWGSGWPYGRGYAPLTTQERNWVKSRINAWDCLGAFADLSDNAEELKGICELSAF